MYLVALDGVTRYALSEAVKFIIRGGLGHTFFPSPVELRIACDQAQRPVNDMARRIRLTEEQIRDREESAKYQAAKTPDARARVAALVAKAKAGLETSRADEREAERAEIRVHYGMTDESLAGIPDQPVPSNFKKLA